MLSLLFSCLHMPPTSILPPLTPSVCLSVSVCLYLSVHVSISHSPSVSLSVSICLCMSLSLILHLFLCLSLSFCLSLLSEALDISDSIPPEIYQMLLVLQSVRKTPPAEQFYQLQSLVSKVVHPYLCMQPSKNSSTLYLPQSIFPSYSLTHTHTHTQTHKMIILILHLQFLH